MEFKTRFARDGFFGPRRILSPRECRLLSRHFDDGRRPPPADWNKGNAVTDRLFYRLSASPELLELLTPILGEDIILWGCSVVRRRSGNAHPWHVDIEASSPEGRFVTVWIGIENTRRNSGLQLIAGSHLSDPIQQVQRDRGYCRGEAPTEKVLEWARERNPEARLVEPELDDGDAILLDSRLWHCSTNDRAAGTRSALLLQFAAADSPVRMYDQGQLEWPFRFVGAPLPPTIVVQGAAVGSANRIVPPPASSTGRRMPMLSSSIRTLHLPLAENPGERWQPYSLFRGSTRILDHLTCHAAVLSAGHSPHPPHSHREEELLIVLDGEAELLIADKPSYDGARVERVQQGDFAYYPASQHHTIRNPGSSPITYLMFKWHVDAARSGSNPLGTTIARSPHAGPQGSKGFVTETIFERPTELLGRLQCHATRLAPGAGYEPHVDAYDVAILTLSGRVETLGQEVPPNSVIYYSAGEKHGMRNVGDEPAHYLVFEFQAPRFSFRRPLRPRVRRLAKRALKRAAHAFGVEHIRRRA